MQSRIEELVELRGDSLASPDALVKNTNLQERDSVGGVTLGIGAYIFTPEDAIEEIQLTDNGIYLTAGEHGSLILTAPGTVVNIAPGGIIRSMDLASDCIIVGGIVSGVITIRANAKVIITNSILDDKVIMEGGSKLQTVGVTFRSNAMIDNTSGVAADAYVNAGYSQNGIAHVNVTVISTI